MRETTSLEEEEEEGKRERVEKRVVDGCVGDFAAQCVRLTRETRRAAQLNLECEPGSARTFPRVSRNRLSFSYFKGASESRLSSSLLGLSSFGRDFVPLEIDDSFWKRETLSLLGTPRFRLVVVVVVVVLSLSLSLERADSGSRRVSALAAVGLLGREAEVRRLADSHRGLTSPTTVSICISFLTSEFGRFRSDLDDRSLQRLARSVAFQNTIDRPHPTQSQPFSNANGILNL